MPLKRLVLVSFILSSFLEANEEIQKSFFEESRSISQCTFYYPILSEQEKMDIQSERISISEESIVLEEDVVLQFNGGLFTSSSANLRENSNLISFNNNADIFLNDLYLQAQEVNSIEVIILLNLIQVTLIGKNLIYLSALILR
tara:strand:- start:2312 stop:2743 length:432 start_codon:yes stop_codon:yes gene_type:complete